MHIIQDFQKWKKINEQETPPRERERGTDNNKVVAIPVDSKTLKLKIVNDADVLDPNEKLTPKGFNDLMVWLKNQKTVWDYYKGTLGDLAKNIVIYSVSKDNSRKQVILFKIYSKAELNQSDATKPGINPSVQFAKQDELSGILGGQTLNGSQDGKILNNGQSGQTSSAGLKLPVKSETIPNSTSAPIITFIKDAYNKVKSQITGNPILAKVKSEVLASKLGTGSQTFVKALNAGYGILDSQFGEDIEKDITQGLVDKLVKPEVLDVEEFNKISPMAAAASTGDIKVPAGGFIEGTQNDPELKKFQDLLAKKFSKVLADHSTFQKFKKAGEKGYLGIYGPLTRDLVRLLKVGLNDPKWETNTNGSIIEPEFVSRVLAEQTNESRTYLALDGFTLITEGLDMRAISAEDKAISSSSPSNSSSSNKSKSAVPPSGSKSSKEYAGSDIGKPEFTYKVEGGFWKYKNGSTWVKVMNPSSIKKLMEKHPKSESGGNYMIIPVTDPEFDKPWAESKAQFIYKKSGDKWQYSTPGPAGWNDVADTKSIKYLDKFYGSGSSSSSNATNKFSGSLSADQLKTVSSSVRSALNTKGLLEEYVSGDTDSDKVSATLDAIKWKIQSGDNVNEEDVFEILADGTFKATSYFELEGTRVITGKISSDLKSIVLANGRSVLLENAVDLTVDWDTSKSQLSDPDCISIAYQLKESMDRVSTNDTELYGNFKRIKSFPDLKKVLIEFEKIVPSGETLSYWINDEGDDYAYKCCQRLYANGLTPRKEYLSWTNGYSYLKDIFNKAKNS